MPFAEQILSFLRIVTSQHRLTDYKVLILEIANYKIVICKEKTKLMQMGIDNAKENIRNFILSNVYLIIGKSLGWGAFGLEIASIIPHYAWLRNENETEIGLWKFCENQSSNETDDWDKCCSSLESEPWLDTSRAFMILATVFVFVGGINGTLQTKYDSKAVKMSGVFFILSGTSGVISVTVFSSMHSRTYPNFKPDVGFILAVVANGMSYSAGVFAHLSAWKMPDELNAELHRRKTTSINHNAFNIQIGAGIPRPPAEPPPVEDFTQLPQPTSETQSSSNYNLQTS